jgi:iron complex transport system substrate-binding protein
MPLFRQGMGRGENHFSNPVSQETCLFGKPTKSFAEKDRRKSGYFRISWCPRPASVIGSGFFVRLGVQSASHSRIPEWKGSRHSMKRWISLVWLLLLFVAAACGGNGIPAEGGSANGTPGVTENQPENKKDGTTTEAGGANGRQTPGSKETSYPLKVTDATGFEMTIHRAPERIVSVSPSETEILFALGLGDRIYGVSDFDNYPPEAADKPKMGNVITPNEEALIAARPDLVIGGISIENDVADRLRSLGIQLYKTEAATVDEVLGNILQIGLITDRQSEAEALVASMRADIRQVTDVVSALREADKRKVYLEFSPGWTVGKGEYLDELITLAGGINIAGNEAGWIQISEEKVILDDPDVILYADIHDDDSGQPLASLIRSRPGWSQIAAIRNNRMVAIDDDLLSRPGPRLTQGLLDIAAAIYPERIQR